MQAPACGAHNYWINATERNIQTFKDAFIAALATTNSDFPLQLWDCLPPQVLNCLNMMHASRMDPSKSAYETLYGPYNWNRNPLLLSVVRSLYTRMAILEGQGHHKVLTDSISGLWWTIIVAMHTTFRRLVLTVFWLDRALSPALPIARHVTSPTSTSPHQQTIGIGSAGEHHCQRQRFVALVTNMCACTSQSSSCYPDRTKGGQTHWCTQSTIKGNWWCTNNHHLEDHGSSRNNEVEQPKGKMDIEENAAAPLTCNKVQYTRHYANFTCCPNNASTSGSPNRPPNLDGGRFTYCHATCHQCTHPNWDQKMPVHICATHFVQSCPFKDSNSTRSFCMPNGTSCYQRDIFKLQKLMNNSATAETWQTAFGKDFGGM